MSANLLAALNGSCSFKQILSFNERSRSGLAVFPSDFQQCPLQPFLSFLAGIIRKKIELNKAFLQIAGDNSESPYQQPAVHLYIERIKQCLKDLLRAGCMRPEPYRSDYMARIEVM